LAPHIPHKTQRKPKNTRSIIMVNRLVATDSWTPISINSSDVTAIQLQGDHGTIHIINVYNDCNHNESLAAVTSYLREPRARACTKLPLSFIWLGDFNRHHPLWDEERNNHLFTNAALELTRPLLDMLGRYNMKMALPKDIPTLKASSTGNLTCVDNVFCSESLIDTIISCNTEPDRRPVKADHYPIITVFDIAVNTGHQEPRYNYRLADWKGVREMVGERLSLEEKGRIKEVAEFERRLAVLDAVVEEAIRVHVPLLKLSPFTKRWWTSELTEKKKEVSRWGRKSYHQHKNSQHSTHERYRRLRNEYSEMIRTAKVEHWVAWLEGLDETSIWDASRLVTGPATDGGRTRVPTLQVVDPVTKRVIREATTNAEKSAMFFETFFPKKPATTSVPDGYVYPPPKWNFKNITDAQIHRSIRKMKPYKATMQGTVPNSFLINTSDILVPHLGPLFRATNTLKHYPPSGHLPRR